MTRLVFALQRFLSSQLNALALCATLLVAPGLAWADFCDIPNSEPPKPQIRQPNGSAPPPAPPHIRQIDHACVAMTNLGCRALPGGRSGWICQTEAATLACDARQKQGKLKQCGGPGLPSGEKYAEIAMGQLGCIHLPGRGAEPVCNTQEAIGTC